MAFNGMFQQHFLVEMTLFVLTVSVIYVRFVTTFRDDINFHHAASYSPIYVP